LGSAFTNEIHTLKTELDKVRREKQAASGLISSLKRDLHTKVKSFNLYLKKTFILLKGIKFSKIRSRNRWNQN
jgi:hypothetical protein